MAEQIEDVVLHETHQKRYLNYALSVITSRALPDVRDGLKPVQRRILYAMYKNLGLTPDSRHRKSAAVVGEVMAKYHPHGDQSIYDAMVRMAQSFSLRNPLVDGQGNFGSLDGDGAAAMRYTEARLRHLAVELLSELKKETVDTRPNYDGTLEEPEVLPAQFPNLLINGASGIAVGMATNIPPHNLKEVVSACIALIDQPELSMAQLVPRYIKGPDFPTGPSILNSKEELREIYTAGSGAIETRGDYEIEKVGKTTQIVITSIPYSLNKSNLIIAIADLIRQGKVPQLTDIRDESTEDIRIVMELKRGANHEAAMAYIYKKTALQTRFNVNFTCLCPTSDLDGVAPKRVDLREMLEHFLEFRYIVTRRRLEFDLRVLEKRIHILRGFAIVFNALDEAIALIRASESKSDAREGLMARFELDHEQAEAILEIRLYKLARFEIAAILEELEEKEAQAAEIRAILESENEMWALIRGELEQIRDAYGDARKSKVTGPVEELEFDEEAYIVAEDSFVVVTRAGWIKRQKSYTDVSAIRVRDGDEIGWVMPSSTRETLVLFTDRGKAYSVRIADIAQTTGHGDAIQTRFDFADGEQIVGVASTDPRCHPIAGPECPKVGRDEAAPPWVVAVSRGGRSIRLPLSMFAEPSNRAGRYYMKLDAKVANDAVLGAELSIGDELITLATRKTHYLLFPAREVNLLGGPGKGVMAIKLGSGDFVIGWALARKRMHGVTVTTSRGREETIRPNKFTVTGRANRGRQLNKTGTFDGVIVEPVEIKLDDPDPRTTESVISAHARDSQSKLF